MALRWRDSSFPEDSPEDPAIEELEWRPIDHQTDISGGAQDTGTQFDDTTGSVTGPIFCRECLEIRNPGSHDTHC